LRADEVDDLRDALAAAQIREHERALAALLAS
jgi:hypothetical protein